nr:MAG TPA: hypothetical protein [Inoviridae sp.]
MLCRGEHGSPANLAPHRFSGKAARIANGHGRIMFAPTVSIPQKR